MDVTPEFKSFIDDLIECSFYPEFVKCLLDPSTNPKAKAHQLIQLMDLCADRPTQLVFFKIVFKFSKYSERTKFSNELKNNKQDSKYLVYEQASNALWDYIDAFNEEYEVVPCGKNCKTRIRASKMYKNWIAWASSQGNRYKDFLEYVESNRSRGECWRVEVFSKFIVKYLNISGRNVKKMKK